MKQQQLNNILVMAARYAHNRKTGAALQVVSAIIAEWENISEQTRVQLAKEASNEATCNYQDWQKLINHHNNQKRVCVKCGKEQRETVGTTIK